MRGSLRLNLLLLLSATSDASRQASNGWLRSSSSLQRLGVQKAVLQVRGGAKASIKDAKKAVKAPAISNPDGASIPNEVFNLVKAIVGVGVLSLPAGIAAFADAKSAFVPAAAMIAVIGVLSGYGFAIIGKVCAYTGATSYREAWAKSIGPKTSWIPAWSAMLKTSMACLAYSMVLGDTFSSLLGTPRTPTLVGMTILILLPLCLMKNLKSLAPFSLLGVMGMAYTALAMTVRWLDGSYTSSGSLVGDVTMNLRPSFGSVGGLESVLNPASLILLCMLSTAYMVRNRHS
jgi:Transmembrane amino acid transporter protein